jgi:site-specific recombinase XerD
MSEELTIKREIDWQPLIRVATDLLSESTKEQYAREMRDFLAWFEAQGESLSRALVKRYLDHLKAEKSLSTVNHNLTAIKRLVTEAQHNGAIPELLAVSITSIKGLKQNGKRTGTWLDAEQAQALLTAPNVKTCKGARDAAIFAVMLGAGLRRSEVVNLKYSQIQKIEGRWAIKNIVGKREKVRSIAIADWIKRAIDLWVAKAYAWGEEDVKKGYLFRPLTKGDRIVGDKLSDQTIYDLLKVYAEQLGFEGLAPHDLRRTFAKLAEKGGTDLSQLQRDLGHEKQETTLVYLNSAQSFERGQTSSDKLGIELEISE